MSSLDEKKFKVLSTQDENSLHDNYRAICEFETASQEEQPDDMQKIEENLQSVSNETLKIAEFVESEANCAQPTDSNSLRIGTIPILVPDQLPDRSEISIEEAIRRHRAIEGVFTRKAVEPSEQMLHLMSQSANGKTREIQKTTENNVVDKNSKQVEPKNFTKGVVSKGIASSDKNVAQAPEIVDIIASLFSAPSPSAEQRLKENSCKTKPGTLLKNSGNRNAIHWNAENSISNILQENAENFQSGTRGNSKRPVSADDKNINSQTKWCQPENSRENIGKIHTKLPNVSLIWPTQVARMQKNAVEQMSQLADHLEVNITSGVRTVAFCGCSPKCGCTTILLCCARELAARGWKTLVIDVNREYPELLQMFDICNEQCTEPVLSLEKHLDILSICNLVDNEHQLYNEHQLVDNGHQLIDSGHKLIESALQFAHQYEIVLLDFGNIGADSPESQGYNSNRDTRCGCDYEFENEFEDDNECDYEDDTECERKNSPHTEDMSVKQSHVLDSKLSRIVQFGTDGILLVFDGACSQHDEIISLEQRIKQFGIVRLGVAENTIGNAKVA